MKFIPHHYGIGALLYTPANLESIAPSLVENRFPTPFSLALCLEDTIGDGHVNDAIATLVHTLQTLKTMSAGQTFYMPKLYIRVRTAQQILDIWHQLGHAKDLVDGWIAPKFTPEDAQGYVANIQFLNNSQEKPSYFMPILESPAMIHLQKRHDFLYRIHDALAPINPLVASIRVGGNDLCHCFGIRRNPTNSIHQIPVISNIFADIITVFSQDYLISGPVWEYFSGDNWDTGLVAELTADRLAGFVGKTVIYPNQIPLVNQAFQVSQTDFADACAILNWDPSNPKMVWGSQDHHRMNEYKTHHNWANHTLLLAQTYGILPEVAL